MPVPAAVVVRDDIC